MVGGSNLKHTNMKPILITHPDAPIRLANYKKSKGYQLNDEWVSIHQKGWVDIMYSLKNVCDENKITLDSLLYELQIVNPIGTMQYEHEWIEKILFGKKTMSIRKTQYSCGYYWLVAPDGKKRGIIEITKVEKWNMNDLSNMVGWLNYGNRHINIEHIAYSSGFDSLESFIAYHRENYSAIKYKHDFTLNAEIIM